mgnify:CR=1 FL=1
MTKNEIVKNISAKTEINKELVIEIIDNFMQCVKTSIANGENVYLRGFGTFENVLRHEKNFHYAPGKYKLIPEHYEVKLKFSDEVKSNIK